MAYTLKQDISCTITNLTSPLEIESFKIQDQLLDQSRIEMHDFEYASKLDRDFKKFFDTEESDHEVARELHRQLNNREARNNTNSEMNINKEINRKIPLNENVYHGADYKPKMNITTGLGHRDNSILSTSSTIPPPTRFNCGSCLQDCVMSKFQIEKMACGCFYCFSCLKDLFMKAAYDATLMPPRCHQKNIDLSITIHILSHSERIFFSEKLDEYNCKNKFYCQNLKCSKFINLDRNTSNPYQCSCGAKNCTKCKTLWHPFFECSKNMQMKNSDDFEILKIQNNWKSCPKCNIVIELRSGCNHITCRNCSYEFCYVCLTLWTGSKCSKGCDLYSGRNLEVMVDNGINNRGLIRRDVNAELLNHVRDNIRNQNECRHRRATYSSDRNQFCGNCDFYMNCYSYKCDNCMALLCKTCYLHRLR